MTLKQMFKKIEAYNEIAHMMGTSKAQIYFADVDEKFGISLGGDHFDDYDAFRKYIKGEYHKEIADLILKSDCWDFDKDFSFEWAGGTAAFTAELVAA